MSDHDESDVSDGADVSDHADVSDGVDDNDVSRDVADPEDSTAAAKPARTGSPAALAASRARRIGGRVPNARSSEPVSSASTDASDDSSSGSAEDDPTEPVTQSKSKSKSKWRRKSESKTGAEPEAKPKSARVRLTKARRPSATGEADRSGDPDEATPSQDSDDAREPKPWLRWIPAAALTVAVLVLAVVVAVSTHGNRWDRPSGGATRDQVLAAAKTCVVNTNSYDYNKLDAFEKKGLACATGTFATQFKSSVEKILRKQAPKVKQKQSLQVNAAGIIDVTGDNQWDILIYGQINVTNTSTKSARIDPFGAVAHLQKVGSAWRISQLCSQQTTATNSCY